MTTLMLGCGCLVLLALAVGNVLPDDELVVSAILPFSRGNLEIYRLDVTHGLIYQLTHDSAADFEPAWSPDGRQIAFSSSRITGQNYHVYTMDARGNNIQRLSTSPETERKPIWSPAGHSIIYQKEISDNVQLMQIDMPSGTARPVTGSPFNEMDAAWSPDGRYLTFVANQSPAGSWKLLTFDFDTGGTFPVMNDSDWGSKPVWSPDGHSILYTAAAAKVRNISLWNVAHAENTVLYTSNIIEPNLGFDWSQDGHSIIFAAATDYGLGKSVSTNGYSGIFKLNVEDCLQQRENCTPQMLTRIPGFYQNPHWRPHSP